MVFCTSRSVDKNKAMMGSMKASGKKDFAATKLRFLFIYLKTNYKRYKTHILWPRSRICSASIFRTTIYKSQII